MQEQTLTSAPNLKWTLNILVHDVFTLEARNQLKHKGVTLFVLRQYYAARVCGNCASGKKKTGFFRSALLCEYVRPTLFHAQNAKKTPFSNCIFWILHCRPVYTVLNNLERWKCFSQKLNMCVSIGRYILYIFPVAARIPFKSYHFVKLYGKFDASLLQT